ncbi:hypothetical protein TrVE_jg153 [Triparma verrucosa]|uniref:Peptide deformylase n=1 Tax=Triparma verrucosa TaxID=1606542 RepID=A0A9W7CAW4_9STRA|nr:hypothetical protein TrVE_jg153 [Triparma verrucosa]
MARYPDPLLRRSASPVPSSAFNTAALQTLASKLKRTCEKEKAVGLAAQQCGVDASIVYLDSVGNSPGTFLVNPVIVKRSAEEKMRVWDEFCLVLPPTLIVTLLRDAEVTVDFSALDGTQQTRTFTGELARAVQHEMDHDLGVLIVDHAATLSELPSWIADLEGGSHSERQAVAFRRSVKCGTECKNRRALAQQSRSNTRRQDVLDLSRQRSQLYNTPSKALQCRPNIPCL